MVVLPAPLGPMMQRSSPSSMSSDSWFSALKPSKLTLMSSRYRIVLCETSMPGFEHAPAGGRAAAVGVRIVDHGGVHARFSRENFEQPDHAARQEQGHEDEQQAEEEQPILGKRHGEHALRAVDDKRAEYRADEAAAPAHRHPDRDLDRVRRRHFARIDDAHLRHVERAGDAADHRGHGPDGELVVHRVVAGEHHARFGVADRGQHAAEFGGDDAARSPSPSCCCSSATTPASAATTASPISSASSAFTSPPRKRAWRCSRRPALLLILTLLFARGIVASKFGRVLTAIRDAESRVMFCGYNPLHYKLLVWTLSAVMCGIAGALYVPQVGIINPGEMSPANSIEIAIWAAVGGRGTLIGADPRRVHRQRRQELVHRRVPRVLAVLPRPAVRPGHAVPAARRDRAAERCWREKRA